MRITIEKLTQHQRSTPRRNTGLTRTSGPDPLTAKNSPKQKRAPPLPLFFLYRAFSRVRHSVDVDSSLLGAYPRLARTSSVLKYFAKITKYACSIIAHVSYLSPISCILVVGLKKKTSQRSAFGLPVDRLVLLTCAQMYLSQRCSSWRWPWRQCP